MPSIKIMKTKDLKFRKAIFNAFEERDIFYQKDIHFGHILNCLILSFFRFIIKPIYSDENFFQKMYFIRGEGYHYGIEKWLRKKGRFVKLGMAVGNIDLMFYNLPYELKSSSVWTKIKFKVQPRQMLQLCLYMASIWHGRGTLKIYNVTHNTEKSYRVSISYKMIKRLRLFIMKRSLMLYQALIGEIEWHELPKPPRKEQCKGCSTCKDLKGLGNMKDVIDLVKLDWEGREFHI